MLSFVASSSRTRSCILSAAHDRRRLLLLSAYKQHLAFRLKTGANTCAPHEYNASQARLEPRKIFKLFLGVECAVVVSAGCHAQAGCKVLEQGGIDAPESTPMCVLELEVDSLLSRLLILCPVPPPWPAA